MQRTSVSAIILTYNEEENLRHCLLSIQGLASEIIVIDSGSTDKTVSIAEFFGAKVLIHEFRNQAESFNWALAHASPSGEWILRLDADEYLTPELSREIEETLENAPAEISGFYIKRRLYFMGRWIKHGGYYPTWLLRLFRKGMAKSEEREMDEHIVLLCGKHAYLENDFVDDNKKDLESWTAKHNKFSSREVLARSKEQEVFHLSGQARRKRWLKESFYMRLPLFFRSLAYFIYRYIFRLGFLDGVEGLIYHTLQGFWHQFLIDSKEYEAFNKR